MDGKCTGDWGSKAPKSRDLPSLFSGERYCGAVCRTNTIAAVLVLSRRNEFGYMAAKLWEMCGWRAEGVQYWAWVMVGPFFG